MEPKHAMKSTSRVRKSNSSARNTSSTFLRGAALMSVSLVVVKLCGMAYKVLMAAMLSSYGDAYAGFGSGLLNNAYEVYNPLFTLATAGFPIAVSRLVAENLAQKRYRDVVQIHKTSKPFFITMGLVCFALMVGGSFIYVNIIEQPYSIYAMMTLAPSIFFGCLISIYRGFYEGQRNMFPTAVSEVIEAMGKVILGLGAAFVTLKIGFAQISSQIDVEAVKDGGTGPGACRMFGMQFASFDEAMSSLSAFAVAAAIAGISLGSLAAFVFLRIYHAKKKHNITDLFVENTIDARTQRETFRMLLKTAVPIGLAALVMSLSATIDTIVVQRVLYDLSMNKRTELLAQFRFDPETLKELFPEPDTTKLHTYLMGAYGWALTIMQLITALTQAFGTSAMPNVTAAYTKGDKTELKKSMETVLKLTMLFTLPMGLGLFAIPQPIMGLLYSGYAAEIGAGVLQIMGLSVIFIAVSTPITSMLQGVGAVSLPLKLYIIAMAIKVATNYLFVNIVSINIKGAAVGSLVAYLFVCVVGMYFLIKRSGVVPDFINTTLKPLIGAVACGAAAYGGYRLFNLMLPTLPSVCCILAVVVAIIVYLLILLVIRTFSAEEVEMLPKSKNIVTILAKLHLLR